MGKVLLAIDSFKGSVSSKQIEERLASLCRSYFPQHTYHLFPISDGGEGLLEAIAREGDRRITALAHDPLLRPISGSYLLSSDGQSAFIEMATVAGLPLLSEQERNPEFTSTYGVGELVRDALQRGCLSICIGLGGSATNDAGVGLLRALGYRFLNEKGEEIAAGGGALVQLKTIDDSHLLPGVRDCRFSLACDVTNPLVGPLGAAAVFAPQKGADAASVMRLEVALTHFARVVENFNGKQIASLCGAGAAGGMGGGLYALLSGALLTGIEVVLNYQQFDRKLQDASLVITGEGCMDRQTLQGKAPQGILRAAQKQRVPVIAVAGRIEACEELLKAGFSALFELSPRTQPLAEAMQREGVYRNLETLLQDPRFLNVFRFE